MQKMFRYMAPALGLLMLLLPLSPALAESDRAVAAPREAAAEEPAEEAPLSADGFFYFVNEDGSARIAGCEDPAGDVSVPAALDGHPVTSIGEDAFAAAAKLISLTLPEGVTAIGPKAFAGCVRLETIALPASLTSIGDLAFSGCAKLSAVTLPAACASLGEAPFWGCAALTEIAVEKGNESYASRQGLLYTADGTVCLACPPGLSGALTLPEGTAAIGPEAFYGCGLLTKVVLPEGVREIGDMAFFLCEKLAGVAFPEGPERIGDLAFAGCALTGLDLPESLVSLGSYAFRDNASLTEVLLPAACEKIGANPFMNCPALTGFAVPEENPAVKVTEGLLFDKEGKTLIACPGGVTGEIAVPGGTEKIGSGAFANAAGLTSVSLPESLASIGAGAFQGCESLALLTLPEGLTNIGASAFSGCGSLTCLRLPDSLARLGRAAFEKCGSLTLLYIPAACESVGDDLFTDTPVTLYAPIGSAAYVWAKENGVPVCGPQKAPAELLREGETYPAAPMLEAKRG